MSVPHALAALVQETADAGIEMAVLSELAEECGNDLLCIRLVEAAEKLGKAARIAMDVLKEAS